MSSFLLALLSWTSHWSVGTQSASTWPVPGKSLGSPTSSRPTSTTPKPYVFKLFQFTHPTVCTNAPESPQSMPNLKSLSLVGKTKTLVQYIDPFGPFTTLTSLSLIFVPLYPSFLHLRTLTNLTLCHSSFKLHLELDTLLDFLEENRSLEHTTPGIGFSEPSIRSSRRWVAIGNRLQSLTISPAGIVSIAWKRSVRRDLLKPIPTEISPRVLVWRMKRVFRTSTFPSSM